MPPPLVLIAETVEPIRLETQPWFGKRTRAGTAPGTGQTPVAIRQTAARQRPPPPGRSRLLWVGEVGHAPPPVALCGKISVLEALSAEVALLEALSGQVKVHLC